MILLESMSPEEIFQELTADAIYVCRKVTSCDKEYRRIVLKTTRFPLYLKPIEYISPKKNKWIILLEARSKKDAEESLCTFVCLADTNKGMYAFMLSVKYNEMAVIIYPPHFFHRYRDRFLKGTIDLKGSELIQYFFRYNPAFMFDSEKATGKIINASCAHGVCLGEEPHPNYVVFKTFITREMLKGDQIPTYEGLLSLLSEAEKATWGSVNF